MRLHLSFAFVRGPKTRVARVRGRRGVRREYCIVFVRLLWVFSSSPLPPPFQPRPLPTAAFSPPLRAPSEEGRRVITMQTGIARHLGTVCLPTFRPRLLRTSA